MSKQIDFIHLHCHSEYSTLDGLPKVEDYVIKSAQLGFKGLALTEHGNMRSMVQLYTKCKSNFNYGGIQYDFDPIKAIFGCEFYLSPNDYRIKGVPDNIKNEIRIKSKSESEFKELVKIKENEMGIRMRFHFLIFAKNSIGFKNLLSLNYLSWKNGFYYRPRIDVRLLEKYSEGLIITTSCVGGVAPRFIINNNIDGAYKHLVKMKKIFKDDLYIEIQPHNLDSQKIANKGLLELSDELKIKVIATNDCHYLNKDDYKAHEMLLDINSKSVRKNISDTKTKEGDSEKTTDRWRFGDTSFYMKSKQEMFDSFRDVHNLPKAVIKDALENTMEIYEKCNFDLKIDKKQNILPKVFVPEKYKNEKQYLISLCKNGWGKRNIKDRIKEYAEYSNISISDSEQVYKDRLILEIKRIFKMKFEKYFLIIYDIVEYCHKNNILTGARGSAGGSFVCYLLGISRVDPIRYDLMFDRFLNEYRMDYPDIDMDFEDSRRKEIFQYLFNKYGANNVSMIGTILRMKGKQALQDVGRVLGIPLWETLQITRHIVIRPEGDARNSQSVADSFKEFEASKQYNKKYPEVLPFVEKLESKARGCGIHAAAIQIAPFNLKKYIPIEFRKDPQLGMMPVAAIDWRECQDMGLVKIDLLGLGTLTAIKYTLQSIYDRQNLVLDIDHIDVEDKKVLDNFTKLKYAGIFQFDSIGMRKTCSELPFTSFEDIIALNSLYRPGSLRSGQAKIYIKRKIGEEKIKKRHPLYDKITKNTYGIVIYQEQLMQVFMYVAGYQPSKADIVRKKVAKSSGTESIWREQDEFFKGAKKNKVPIKIAKWLFKNMSFFGCVSGDTYLHRVSANQFSEEQIKIKDLYNDIQNNKLVKYKIRDGKFKLKCLDEICNKVKIGNVIDIVRTGRKKVYLVTTESGKFIECTKRHKLKKDDKKYYKLSELKVGDNICVTDFVRNNSIYKNKGIGKGGRSKGKSYNFHGLGSGSKNINYVDNRTKVHLDLKLWLTDKYDCCQNCGSKKYLEMHHKNYNHNDDRKNNVVLLCRKCHRNKHKEQLQRYTNGYLTYTDKIINIKYIGIRDTYDVCMTKPNNNYVVNNGIIAHNSYAFNKSHAASYAMIAYWGMYLKTYYPLDFYYGLLKQEKDEEHLFNFIKDAKKEGIKILPPDINKSGIDFKIIDNNAIIVGLEKIKGCGSKAASNIAENQPYISLYNFGKKVDRRIVNRGVVKTLINSLAFKSLYNNTAVLLYEIKDNKKKNIYVYDLMLSAKNEKESMIIYKKYENMVKPFSLEDEERMTAKVSPIPPEKHEIEYYNVIDKYINNGYDLISVKEINTYFDIEGNIDKVNVKGIIVDIKYNSVGDFHKESLDELTKKRMNWGKRYAAINIDDGTDIHRIKIGYDVFPTYRYIVDKGIGTPVAVAIRKFKRFDMIAVDNMCDLNEFRDLVKKYKNDANLIYKNASPLIQYFMKHPVDKYKSKSTFNVSTINKRFGIFNVICLISKIKFYYTKKDDLMAFVQIEDSTGAIDTVCWPEILNKNIKIIKIGNIIEMEVQRNNSGCYITNKKIKLLNTFYEFKY